MLRAIKAKIRSFLLKQLEPHLNVRDLKIVPLHLERDMARKAFEDKTEWLRATPFQTVLDVGASKGYSSRVFRRFWPQAQILAFEPLEECFLELSKSFGTDRRFKAFHSALGEKEEVSLIHRNDYSVSSSLLPMDDLHVQSFPHTKNSSAEKVSIRRLDDIAGAENLVGPILMKLDVQGFEGQVLRGGLETLKQVQVIITEMSVSPLYKGQIEFDELYRLLVSLGFKYQGNYDQLHSPVDGRILQVDGIFVRDSIASSQA